MRSRGNCTAITTPSLVSIRRKVCLSVCRAFPIAEALDLGADVVVTGRCVDSALTLGPLIHKVAISVHGSMDQSINQSINQSTNQPINQPTNQYLISDQCS